MKNRNMKEVNTFQDKIQRKLEKNLADLTTRSMFGYQCYSVKGKFFVGFSKKEKDRMIIRLSKDLQKKALQMGDLKIRPFSHGVKMGWIELDCNNVDKIEEIFAWIKQGYDYALAL